LTHFLKKPPDPARLFFAAAGAVALINSAFFAIIGEQKRRFQSATSTRLSLCVFSVLVVRAPSFFIISPIH
jgi:hypothetical protein